MAKGLDLTVAGVDISGVSTDLDTLIAVGAVRVDIQNVGASAFDGSFDVLLF